MSDRTVRTLQQVLREEIDRIDETEARRTAELEEQLTMAREIAADATRGPRKAVAGQARDAAKASLRGVGRLAADRRRALAMAADDLAALLGDG
ncbi:hypothetical protein [Kitasatospora sp. NPDC088346]|uniref:hypothetical protein n=1 Tax=Kitasatospora sp. NPDC088346 TaxID=3364073 RepID=UPI0038280FD2